MTEHYIITADRGHLRIYRESLEPGQSTPALHTAEALDFPAGVTSYAEHDSDRAGRFPGSKGQAAGMSIDERLPMQEQRDQRLFREIADCINAFLTAHPRATWAFAAGPAVHRAVLDRVAAGAKHRLRRILAKDLVNQPPSELLSHFSAGAEL